jgi:hypothetical protein
VPTFLAGDDRVRVATSDRTLLTLAAALWVDLDEASPGPDGFQLDIEGVETLVREDPEEALRWRVDADETLLAAPGIHLRVRPPERRAEGTFSRNLLRERPDLVTRLLLEMVRQQVLHAGAVVGPAGAAVLRGAGGAGKSTLVAACHAAGLGLLGDESLLVHRGDPDRLEATLRDLILTPDSARLLDREAISKPVLSGGEAKRRVLLPWPASPADRLARRVATVLLGPREPGPARLLPISGPRFLAAFAAGEIPQERMYAGSPETIAAAWNGRATYLLVGAVDLGGAVDQIRDLVHGFRAH